MIMLEERIKKSNDEIVFINDKIVPIKEHLPLNKILLSADKHQGKELGFFKLWNDKLQIHICITNKDGISEWHRFFVLDANTEENARNKKLNIGGDKNGTANKNHNESGQDKKSRRAYQEHR